MDKMSQHRAYGVCLPTVQADATGRALCSLAAYRRAGGRAFSACYFQAEKRRRGWSSTSLSALVALGAREKRALGLVLCAREGACPGAATMPQPSTLRSPSTPPIWVDCELWSVYFHRGAYRKMNAGQGGGHHPSQGFLTRMMTLAPTIFGLWSGDFQGPVIV